MVVRAYISCVANRWRQLAHPCLSMSSRTISSSSSSSENNDDSSSSSSPPSSLSVVRVSRDYVPGLDGLRSLALLWVVSFHTQFFAGATMSRAKTDEMMDAAEQSALGRPMLNGHLGVDVFFVLSGFLIARNLLRDFGSSSSSSPTTTTTGKIVLRFFIRRLFRIVPCFYFTLAIYCFVTSLIPGDGIRKCSGFPEVTKNLFFFQNMYPMTDQCMAWAWTISVEAHFYLLAPPLIFIPMLLFRKSITSSFFFLQLATIISVLISYSVISDAHLDVPSTLRSSNHDVSSPYFKSVYSSTQTRLTACLIGACAYHIPPFLSSVPPPPPPSDPSCRPPPRFGSSLALFLGLVGLAFTLAVVFGDLASWSAGLDGATFLTLGRPAFSLALSLQVVSLTVHSDEKRSGRYDNDRLLHKIWDALASVLDVGPFRTAADLSYPTFLLHPLLISGLYLTLNFGESGKPPPSVPFLSGLCAANFCVAMSTAVAMHLLLEWPFVTLGRATEIWALGDELREGTRNFKGASYEKIEFKIFKLQQLIHRNTEALGGEEGEGEGEGEEGGHVIGDEDDDNDDYE